MKPLHHRVKLTEPANAVDALSAATGLPKARIKDAMSKGAVWVQRGAKSVRLRRASRVLNTGEELAIYYNPGILAERPPEPELVADRTGYSVWNKPAGMFASGSRYGDHHSIVRYVECHWDRPSLLVHRLDRYTRGLMVIAHAKRVAADLSRQFRERSMRKVYRAEVVGELRDACTVDLALAGKSARSHVAPLQVLEETTLVEVVIESGRKHQIRQHLALLGHPVVGDALYGAAQHPDLRLSAVELAFACPVNGERVTFKIDQEVDFPSGTRHPARDLSWK